MVVIFQPGKYNQVYCIILCIAVQKTETRISYILGKHYITEVHPQYVFKFYSESKSKWLRLACDFWSNSVYQVFEITVVYIASYGYRLKKGEIDYVSTK